MIYFIQAEEGGPVKIGYTAGDTANERLRACQVGSPLLLRIVMTMEGNGRDEARLHRQFAASRSHGEWFHVSPDLLAFLNESSVINRKLVMSPRLYGPAGAVFGPLPEDQQAVLDVFPPAPAALTPGQVRDLLGGLVDQTRVHSLLTKLHHRERIWELHRQNRARPGGPVGKPWSAWRLPA